MVSIDDVLWSDDGSRVAAPALLVRQQGPLDRLGRGRGRSPCCARSSGPPTRRGSTGTSASSAGCATGAASGTSPRSPATRTSGSATRPTRRRSRASSPAASSWSRIRPCRATAGTFLVSANREHPGSRRDLPGRRRERRARSASPRSAASPSSSRRPTVHRSRSSPRRSPGRTSSTCRRRGRRGAEAS